MLFKDQTNWNKRLYFFTNCFSYEGEKILGESGCLQPEKFIERDAGSDSHCKIFQATGTLFCFEILKAQFINTLLNYYSC